MESGKGRALEVRTSTMVQTVLRPWSGSRRGYRARATWTRVRRGGRTRPWSGRGPGLGCLLPFPKRQTRAGPSDHRPALTTRNCLLSKEILLLRIRGNQFILKGNPFILLQPVRVVDGFHFAADHRGECVGTVRSLCRVESTWSLGDDHFSTDIRTPSFLTPCLVQFVFCIYMNETTSIGHMG